jgi:hypothetical protein
MIERPAGRVLNETEILWRRSTMKFMMIAKATKDSEAGTPPDPRLMAAIGKLAEEMARAGVLVTMGGLAPSSMGARLRLADGKVTITDGPFTEAKEIIGGFAIIDVKSKAEALELARRFWELHADVLGPSYVGEGEVRQLFDGGSAKPRQLGRG